MELKYQIHINNKFSELASERLLSFVIEDNSGLQLDSLELALNNADDSIAIPSTNAVVEIVIGDGENQYKMGKFVAQNINANNNTITVKAISQDLQKGRIKHNRVFKNVSLQDILQTLANDLGLQAQVDSKLHNKQIAYYLQDNKTSLEVVVELAEIFYAIANIKNNNLVFVGKNHNKSLAINEENILSITKKDSNLKVYNGVLYEAWDIKKAELNTVKNGSEPYLLLNNNVDNSLKNDYIISKYAEIQEKQLITLSLKQGNPQLQAGFNFSINSTENYSQFNGHYRIEKVIHRYSNTYVNSILAVKV